MKKIFLILMAVTFISSAFAVTVFAESSDEVTLDKHAAEIAKDSTSSDGEKLVVEELKKHLKIDDATIDHLKKEKLGYGEMTILSALASASGKTTDQILAMRNGPPVEGWGLIAKKLDVNLGLVVSQVEKVRSEASKDLKGMETAKLAKSDGKREKGEKLQKFEKPEMPERHNR